MSRSQTLERFPDTAVAQSNQRARSSSLKSANIKTRPRRKSSGLGADIRGDTSAPALSTLDTSRSPLLSPPLSPRNFSSTGLPRRSKRRKVRSFLRRWKNLSFTHTWINPLILIAIILTLYGLNPTPSNPLHKALFLSYELPSDHPHIPQWAKESAETPAYYGKGLADLSFVSFYIIVLSFTREFLMQRLIRPMAIRAGIKSKQKQSRFMEQVYTAIYFSVFGPFGLYVMKRTPVWYFNTTAMYEEFPHRAHDGMFKAYYLLQASYWAQQAIVLLLRLEKPRKDYNELVGHHVVTLMLIGLSYRFHFTYMGLAVYITHDISDFFLATAKTLNYIDASITSVYFAMFTCIWIYLRHYINLRIIYSITTTFATVGDFTLNWDTQQYKCWISQYITFGLLAALQSLNLFWLFLILRISYNAVFRAVLGDERSDDEEDEVESLEEAEQEARDKELRELQLNVGTAATGVDRGLEDVPEVLVNGHSLNGTAKKRAGESYKDALKENQKLSPQESYVEAKKENLKNR